MSDALYNEPPPPKRTASAANLRRLVVCLATAGALLACSSHPCVLQAQSKTDEYRVKAAFLFHFAQLVEWPATADDHDTSLQLCTVGEDPFHGELENTVEGKAIGSRVLHIRHLKDEQATQGCNMVFIGQGEGKRLSAILAGLHNSPVLTVGEAADFLGSGGMIRFCLEGNKVRFEINREAAESAKLRISSKLLLLARNVAGTTGGQ